MNRSILVVGSSNTDMVVQADHLPVPGETILGGAFLMNPGGKGANQAVAAARLGGEVCLIAKTGNDIFGKQSTRLFQSEGINTDFMLSDPYNPSGVALITVDKHAENCIVVASGSNATLSPVDLIPAHDAVIEAKIVLMQLEIPIETVNYVAALANRHNVKVILNPAPAQALSDDVFRHITIITPNSTEAQMLTGVVVNDVPTAIMAGRELLSKGVETVVITLGSNGAVIIQQDIELHIPAPKVKALDTTAAGDVFNGALAVAIAAEKTITEAVDFACRAAAVSVTRLGAQSSAPYLHELDLTSIKASI